MTTREAQRRAKKAGRYGKYDTKPGTKPDVSAPEPEPKPLGGKFEAGRIVRARLNVEAAMAQQRRRAPGYGTPGPKQAPRPKREVQP